MHILQEIMLAMIPLVIAVDPAAVVTIFLGLTEKVDQAARRRIARDALATALVIGLGFMFLGAVVFTALGIDKADFQIGGGLILLVLSLSELIFGDRNQAYDSRHVGVVPIGTPLIIGPAVLTALTLLQTEYGNAVTVAAFIFILAVLGICLAVAPRIRKAIGPAGLNAVSKIISILLAAFAVHLVRMGIMDIIG